MKVKTLKEALSEYSDDANVEVGRLIGTKRDGTEMFDIILDAPIIGLAFEESSGDLRFVVEAGPHLVKFGKVKRLDNGSTTPAGG